MEKIRLYYSKQQQLEQKRKNKYVKSAEFLNPKTKKYESYTEITTTGSDSKWSDAVCVLKDVAEVAVRVSVGTEGNYVSKVYKA